MEKTRIMKNQKKKKVIKKLFKQLQDNEEIIKLPNKMWLTAVAPDKRILYSKFEPDYSTSLNIVVYPNMKVEITYGRETIDWIQCDPPKTVKDVQGIVNAINTVPSMLEKTQS